MKRALILLFATCLSLSVQAHGDEDHSHDTQPAGAKPAGAKAVAAPLGDASQRLADGSLFVPKPVQRTLGVRTALAVAGDYPQVIEMPGRVIADPSAGGRVQTPQTGTIAAGPDGLARLGQKVNKGQVLAVLLPTLDSAARADRQSGLAELDAQIAVQEKRVARLTQLEGSVPQKDIEQARIELQSLKARRGSLGGALSARVVLSAPVSGVVAASQVVLGQVVDAKEILFEIVDPRRLAVEALAFDSLPIAGLGPATARVGDKRDEVIALDFLGAGRSLREQALPVMFRVRAPEGGELPPLALGQTLKVFAETTAKQAGVAVPASSLVRNAANESLLWVHEKAERFVARRVKTVPLDASRVLVLEGLKGGERVVSQGAPALNQVR